MKDEIICWARRATTTALARKELHHLLTTKIRPRGGRFPGETAMDGVIECATTILQDHPILASEEVRGLFSLVHLLLARAQAKNVVAVCRLCPKALWEPFET